MFVGQMPTVELSIIARFVIVNFVTQEIPSQDVTPYHVRLLKTVLYNVD